MAVRQPHLPLGSRLRFEVQRTPYTMDPLSQVKMSWLLRQRLRRVKERHGPAC
jgi:hypothetical protein